MHGRNLQLATFNLQPMTFRTLTRRSLRFHWRSHLGVVLGAAVGSAALIGALVVGDSVKQSLLDSAMARLGWVDAALSTNDRFFPSRLVTEFNQFSTNGWLARASAFLELRGTVARQDGTARANRVNVLGMSIYSTAMTRPGIDKSNSPLFIAPGSVMLNSALAHQLKAQVGDEVVVRVYKPSAFSRELAVSPRSDTSLALRLRVSAVSAPDMWDAFNLRADGVMPLNALIDSGGLGIWMERKITGNATVGTYETGLSDKANRLVFGDVRKASEGDLWDRILKTKPPLRWFERAWYKLRKSIFSISGPNPLIWSGRLDPKEAMQIANKQLELATSLEISDLSLRTNENLMVELRSDQVFLPPPAARAAFTADSNVSPLLTLLANLLLVGTNATPYSMVTAAGPPWTPADMRDDEILVSQWLAEDLQVKPGDEIAMSYFLPESGAKLTEATNTFRVRAIVPMEMPWADRTLMPDFPGIEKAESTSDWDAGFPLTYKIREKDEDYWRKYRGTPKAFITLAAGQKMWGNRFGNLTAIRFPIPTNGVPTLTPTLSLRERENHSPSPGNTKTGDHSTALGKIKNEQQLSPLPAGEGQGEGERHARTNRVDPPHVVSYKAALEKKILANLKPEELGLRFEPVREQALKAAAESQDFGGLFLGFSFFVIAAALLLMALLFSLGLEQRAPEIGTLLALGFTPKQVRKLLLREGVMLSLLGGILGTLGGLVYAKAMLRGLTTVWRDAVGESALSFHFTGQTLAIGLLASVVVSTVTIWFSLRKFVRRPARELLVGEIAGDESKVQRLRSKAVAAGALLAALGLVGWSVVKGDTSNAGIFFGAGALVLIGGLAMVHARLVRLANSGDATLTPALSLRERGNHSPISGEMKTGDSSTALEKSRDGQQLFPLPGGEGQGEGERGCSLSLSSLGLRGCARRRKRSLSTVAMLACGSFLIVSIGVFRLDANRDAWKKTSGTGGFALIGETTMPVVHDLNSQSGRDFFALNQKDLAGVHFIPFRLREGDEASCLNLNRAQKPRLLGVSPEMLTGRFGFAKGSDWKSLGGYARESVAVAMSSDNQPRSDERSHEIPAIGDANSIQWAMHKKVGDTIDYVDERGQPFKVRIVGAVANSILQGSLIIDEAAFVKRFPSESGYRMFLIDAPSNSVSQVSATLSRAMQDVGLELTPAAERLAQFNAVQNTYLGTFQVLGGLGLLLGSVGLGIVVLRNVLERRGELAVLLAVGFRKATLQRLLLIENGALLATGLALGMVAAAVAVLPALLSPNAQLPYGSLALTLGAVLVNGALWTWAATRLAVRGDLLAALRNE